MSEARSPVGRWYRETGEGGPPIYRRVTGRMRGRQTLELLPDGRLLRSTPGPDDRLVVSGGTWTLSPGVTSTSAAEDRASLAVAMLDDDRLMITGQLGHPQEV